MTRLRPSRRRRPALVALVAFVAFGALAGAIPRDARAKPKPRKPPLSPAAPSPPPEAAPGRAPTPPATEPKSVEVTVVELAGSRAFLQPGAAAGIHRGSSVLLHGKTFPVVDASDSFAVIYAKDDPPREQEKGRATLVPQEALKPVELPKPRPLTAWEHAWDAEQAPADAQHPEFVPLGGDERNRRFDVRISVAAGGLIPLPGQVGSAMAMGELNARVHAEPFSAPLKLDLDASLQGWAAADLASRVGGSTRAILYVRELLASYTPPGWFAGIGRLRYAASTLGTLDGARLQKDLGDGFSIAAFGGLLPNPLNGGASLDAERFGVEGRYARPDLALRPEASLVAHGSVFGGGFDERRLSGTISLYPGPSRIGGYFEVSNFDAYNPWNEPAVALTAAGLDTSIRAGIFDFGARFDVRQPELSRWLASYLPSSWFCTTVPASNPVLSEPCNGSISSRAFGEIDAGFVADKFSLSLGGTTVKDLGDSDAADSIGGFAAARVTRIARVLRLEASGNVSGGTYISMFGGTVGPGVTLLEDVLDASVYYRISVLQYRSVATSLVQNGVGGTLALFPNATVFFTFQGEGTSGDDVSALTLFGTATWHPRF
jgi:hypothetical protein